MSRFFVRVLLGVVLLSANIAIGSALPTVERWRCERESLVRVLRHVAVEAGKAPCKIFYYKHVSDAADKQEEAKEDAGDVHPIFYSDHTDDFCARKLAEFLADREKHDWTCTRM